MALSAAVLAVVALVCVSAAPAGTSPTKTRVTVIGDSVMASFGYVPAARRYLGKGLDLRSDAVVCRRLVAASCAFQGATPTTALELIGAKGRALGPVVVINVGYNDWTAVYDVDRVMRALRAARVHTVIWVTLRATTSNYAGSNARSATPRDGRRASSSPTGTRTARGSRGSGRTACTSHHQGAFGLAHLLRPLVLTGI